MDINSQQIAAQIEIFIHQSVKTFERDGVVLGMSGGIDSSVVAVLAARAIGAENMLALMLPERDSSPESKSDALLLIEALNIPYREVSLAPILSQVGIYKLAPLQLLGARTFKEAIVKRQHRQQAEALHEMPFRAGLLGTHNLPNSKTVINAGNAYARSKHRMRMLILYYYADLENRLVLGTTNKSESLTGFVVKWGDNVADIEPILSLYKTQVRQLAAYLNIPQTIIDKAPSPDLIPGIVDEVALGIDYVTLDKILWGLEHNLTNQQIQEEFRVSADQVVHVQEMHHRSTHLRQLPPAFTLNQDMEITK